MTFFVNPTMVDTARIWIPNDSMKDIDTFSEIPQYLDNVRESYALKTGKSYISGNMKNLKVLISEIGVRIEGSLPKFIYGSNFYVPDSKGIHRAIEECSDHLKINVGEGRITRLHIAYNIQTEHKPELYYPYFGNARYYSRLKQPHSIYYSNSKRVIHIYDKGLEARKKKAHIPTEFIGKNLLRIEYRLEKNVKKYLDRNPLQAKDLWTKAGYELQIAAWKNAFAGIKKLPPISFDITSIKKPKQFFEYYALLGMKECGGMNAAL